jgi:septal ring factor EnvC (AmiA/AmiB activator)
MTSIERGVNNTALETIHESISQAEQAMRNTRTIIKAQAARIAELEKDNARLSADRARLERMHHEAVEEAHEALDRVDRLEDNIARASKHLGAKHYGVAALILEATARNKEMENGKDEGNGLTVVPRSREPRPDYGPAACGKSRLTEQLGFIWREGERPELELAFTQERRGVRYLKLMEQLGDDSTTFRAWWADIRR